MLQLLDALNVKRNECETKLGKYKFFNVDATLNYFLSKNHSHCEIPRPRASWGDNARQKLS